MDHLQCELNDIQEQITDLSETSAPPKELQHHQEMIRKTDGNLEKQKLELSGAEQRLKNSVTPPLPSLKPKSAGKEKATIPQDSYPTNPCSTNNY